MEKLVNDSCPYCSSKNALFVKVVNSNNLFQCNDCILQFFSPRIFEKEIYEGEKVKGIYETYHQLRKQPTIWLLELISVLKKLNIDLSHKLILEIGAGDALNYEYLRRNFSIQPEQYEILELDAKSVAAAKKRGIITAYTQFFDESFAKNNYEKYDVLVITEVIEHQDDLATFLKNAYAILNKNGLILITTPNRERVFLKIGERTDTPPHHFLRYNRNFFEKNFKDKLIYSGYYFLNHQYIVEYAQLLAVSKLRYQIFWPLFYPLLILKFFISKILNRGEGLVVFLKK